MTRIVLVAEEENEAQRDIFSTQFIVTLLHTRTLWSSHYQSTNSGKAYIYTSMNAKSSKRMTPPFVAYIRYVLSVIYFRLYEYSLVSVSCHRSHHQHPCNGTLTATLVKAAVYNDMFHSFNRDRTDTKREKGSYNQRCDNIYIYIYIR